MLVQLFSMRIKQPINSRCRRKGLLEKILNARELAKRIVHLQHRHYVHRECSYGHGSSGNYLSGVQQETGGDEHPNEFEYWTREIHNPSCPYLSSSKLNQRAA